MRRLYHIGVESFKSEYTHTKVFQYLLSVLLKSKAVPVRDISEHCGISLKQAQRYAYDRLGRLSFNLDDVIKILELTDVTINELLDAVFVFIKHKYEVSLFTTQDRFKMYFNSEYFEQEFKTPELKALVKYRSKTIIIYKMIEHSSYYDCLISKYPSSLIREVTRKC